MQLEAEIKAKAFTNAAGERQDVLGAIHFALGDGEAAVFIGPSGCGKSTMLRILLGLDTDFEGRILRPPGARVGMVFQEPRLLPWRTVEQNVRLAAPAIGESELASLFKTLELDGHRGHYPGELSLGLARRVALARAFAIGPDLLVLDEPLASLDDALAGRLREEIATLMARGRLSAILVTHSVEDAIRLGDRIFFLSARPARIERVLAIATPRADRSERELNRIRAELRETSAASRAI